MDIQAFNHSPYLSGVALIMLNMGSRFVIADLGEFQQQLLATDLMKRLILFCMFFVATRDVVPATVLTVVFSILIYGLFNEHSKYSLVPDMAVIKGRLQDYYVRVGRVPPRYTA